MIPSYILIFHLSLQVHTKIAVSCVPREYEQVKSNELLKESLTQGKTNALYPLLYARCGAKSVTNTTNFSPSLNGLYQSY